MSLTPEQFESVSQLCAKTTGRPWDGTLAHLSEATARQSEANEILDRHADWLTPLRERAATNGRPWTAAELRRQSRLAGDLTVCPEWVVAEAAR